MLLLLALVGPPAHLAPSCCDDTCIKLSLVAEAEGKLAEATFRERMMTGEIESLKVQLERAMV